MQGMIHHHAQALRMTALVPTRSTSDGLALLARRIDVSQETEIDQMRSWLEARGEAAPVLHRSTATPTASVRWLMPGMLSDRELKRLDGRERRCVRPTLPRVDDPPSRGSDDDGDASSSPATAAPSQRPDAFARHVDADQQIEIARMKETLKTFVDGDAEVVSGAGPPDPVRGAR